MSDEVVNLRPQVQRREAWIDLPAEYAGFKFRLWVNAPTKLWNAISSGNDTTGRAALKQVVLEHNEWRDFDGNVYPPPAETAFWDDIPNELLAVILVASRMEMAKLPNSMPLTKRR